MLNDTFFRARAADFARRLLADGGTNPEEWVDRSFGLVASRLPSDAERTACVEFIRRQMESRGMREPSQAPEANRTGALTDFCQTLFSLNEFIYVD